MPKILKQEEVQKRISDTFVQNVELYSEYKNKRTPVKLHCKECNFIWEVKPQNFLSRENHICPNCYNLKTNFKIKCAYCGKEIIRQKSQILKNKSGFFYCSRECGNYHKNQIRFENGEWEESANYRGKALTVYEHKCLICGWNEDERVLEVHHIDENRQNNQINNLVVLCPTCHRKITLGYYILDIENKTLVKKPENCKQITLEENARRTENVDWITVGEETLTRRQWSEKLGLSIRTINKWVRKYGLNRTIKLIEAIQENPEKKNERKSNKSLFDIYDI